MTLLKRQLPALLTGALASFLATTLVAQDVSMSLTALTPLRTTVVLGPQTSTDSLPAGLMSDDGFLATSDPSNTGLASIQWFNIQTQPEFAASVQFSAATQDASLAASTTNTTEVLVEISATAATRVEIDLRGTFITSDGAPPQQLDVDIDNDGVIDILGLPFAGLVTLQPADIGPQAKQLRLIVNVQTGQQIGPVSASAYFDMNVRPINDVLLLQTAPACDATSSLIHVPVFTDRAIFIGNTKGLGSSLYVIGASVQPALLTPQSILPFAQTCLLVPSPDVLIWAPTSFYSLVVPATLRPIQLHLQAIYPTAQGWKTSESYRIDAF